MNHDAGVIYVLLEHFVRHLYPRALEMERKLNAGESLSDSEIDHVAQVLEDTRLIAPLIDRHPEHRELAAGVIGLYASIAQRAWHAETARAAAPGMPPDSQRLQESA
jgi:hypothetical protein